MDQGKSGQNMNDFALTIDKDVVGGTVDVSGEIHQRIEKLENRVSLSGGSKG